MADKSKSTNHLAIDHGRASKKPKLDSDGPLSWNHFANDNPTALPTCNKLCAAHCPRSSPTPTILDSQKNQNQYGSEGVAVLHPKSGDSSLRKLVEQVICELPEHNSNKNAEGGVWLVVRLKSRY